MSMTRQALAIVAASMCFVVGSGQAQSGSAGPGEAAPGRITIRGTIADAGGKPVDGALVVACDADSGMPLCGEQWESLGALLGRVGDEALARLQFCRSTADGTFEFKDVPKRGIRLIAQQWQTVSTDQTPLAVNGASVVVATSHVVDPDAALDEPVGLEPRGDAWLSIHCESGNDETLVMVSTSPTIADPILGFSGWQGPFMRNVIAWNRAPQGETAFARLPAGKAYIAIFSADNNPGFGQAEVELRDGWTTEVEIPWVASWSNGMHLPPESIARVREQLREHDLLSVPRLMEYLEKQGVELRRPDSPLRALAMGAEVIEKRVDLPDQAGSLRVGDALAAVAYVGMENRLESQGRTPNPHRAPVATMHMRPAESGGEPAGTGTP